MMEWTPFARALLTRVWAVIVLGFCSAGHVMADDVPMFETVGPRFVQDRFVIGFWHDMADDGRLAEHYREIARAHFNMVIVGFYSPTDYERLMRLSQENGLKAIAYTSPLSFPDEPACWGYVLKDEPPASDFPKLAQQVAELRTTRPGKLGFVNLYPITAGSLGMPYDEYVGDFVHTVHPDVLSMDNYPTFTQNGDSRAQYIENLAVLRKYSLQAGIPFWNFFNAIAFAWHTAPTAGQIRWQIYTSITYGAKGVMYFTYSARTPPVETVFYKGDALLTGDGRLTRHYDQAMQINARIEKLGPTLMKLTSTGVYHVTSRDSGAARRRLLSGTPVQDVSVAQPDDPPIDLLLGMFRLPDGRRAVMITNYEYAYTAWPTVQFAVDPAKIMEVDQQNGELRPLIDESPAIPGVQISLDSGEGRLFVVP